MSVVVDGPVSLSSRTSLPAVLQSPVRWRRRKLPSPIVGGQNGNDATQPPQPQNSNIQNHQHQQQLQRRSALNRRSDPGLLAMAFDLELQERNVVESRWDMSRTSAPTSCGLNRSMSLRNSFLRQREPLWIQSKSVWRKHSKIRRLFAVILGAT